MKKSIFDRRIPTVFALFLLVGGIAVTTFLLNQGAFIRTRATPTQEPKNVTVTNITSSSFTVSFTTLEETVAAVSFTRNGQTQLIFDDRDGDQKNAYFAHQITVKDLSPNQEYSFQVLSNGTTYPETEGEVFTGKTAGEISGTPISQDMKGAVQLPDAATATDTLLVITPENGSPISAVTNNRGEYTIPGRLLMNRTLTSYLDEDTTIPLSITAKQADLESQVETQFIPNGLVPLISLSSNYQFIASMEEELVGSSSSVFQEPDTTISNRLQILSPSENQNFVDARPQFTGTSRAGTVVRIFIDGQSAAQLRSSPNGNWSYRPTTPLATGAHTIAIEGTGTSGSQRITRDFSIFASGSQIAQSATPSATLTPTKSPTITVAPTITTVQATIAPTATPTTLPTPTAITVTSIPIGAPSGVVSPTPTNIPIPTTFVPTKIPLPPAGMVEQSVILTGVAILFIVAGTVLFFVL